MVPAIFLSADGVVHLRYYLILHILNQRTSISTTSAVSSTNFGSIVIFASCVLHRSPVFSKFFMGQNLIYDDVVLTYSTYHA